VEKNNRGSCLRDPKIKYEDEWDAQRSIVEESDKTYKKAAYHLYPELKPDTGYAKLKACVNQEKDGNLTFGRIIEISKFCNRADALFFMCDELGYERPIKKKTEDEEKLLVDRYLKAKEEMERASQEMYRASEEYTNKFYKNK